MLYQRDGARVSRGMKDTWYISVAYRSTTAPCRMGVGEAPTGDAFGNVTSWVPQQSGSAESAGAYCWLLISGCMQWQAKIESTVSETGWKAHSHIKKDPAAPPAAAAPRCYLNYKSD